MTLTDVKGCIYLIVLFYTIYKIIDLTIKIRRLERGEDAGVRVHDLSEDE